MGAYLEGKSWHSHPAVPLCGSVVKSRSSGYRVILGGWEGMRKAALSTSIVRVQR